jgi:hypothetical protein
MDVAYQVTLITGAATDYQDGLMSLQTLIHKVEGRVAVIEDDALERSLSDALFALESINAHTLLPGNDFDAHGKSVVDRAVKDIVAKTESHSSRSG